MKAQTMQALQMKRPKLSAANFRRAQDEILQLDHLDMARLLGLKLARRSNAVRTVERFRNGDTPVSGTVSTIIWFAVHSEQIPDWWPALPDEADD